MGKQKWYVIWQGTKTGVFSEWKEVEGFVAGVKGAKYKAFATKQEAETALGRWWEAYYGAVKKVVQEAIPFFQQSIVVDAACSSATKIMEYQGIDLATGKQVFAARYEEGTNNIGEFLAIVHGLAWIQKEKKADYVLYSDSLIAMKWVNEGRCKTSFIGAGNGSRIWEAIKRAEQWLAEHKFSTQVLKWQTEEWGENPADYGRK